MTTPANTTKLSSVRARARSAQAQAAVREILVTQRFICHFDGAGQLQLAELRTGTLCIHPADLPTAIAAGTIAPEILLAILAAASARLGIAMPSTPVPIGSERHER